MAGIFISCFPIFSPNMSGISDSEVSKNFDSPLWRKTSKLLFSS